MRIRTRQNRKGCALSALEENWAKAQKGAIRHFESASTPKVLNGTFGHLTHFRAPVRFGLFF